MALYFLNVSPSLKVRSISESFLSGVSSHVVLPFGNPMDVGTITVGLEVSLAQQVTDVCHICISVHITVSNKHENKHDFVKEGWSSQRQAPGGKVLLGIFPDKQKKGLKGHPLTCGNEH